MKDGMVEKGIRVDTVEWWMLIGSHEDLTLSDIGNVTSGW